ncbi:NAD(P)H-dependent glycerol-3-phosphate dehydrogenase ['Camptotheca acuminata' phytoplasma]|uniref:NAD(P)H-dependent glycerol-3-phosphate dehydrogenase n=1 Tax='Camptotheca acuminata' phytoplasma TaxID=3239192 RepID=UPI00351A4099
MAAKLTIIGGGAWGSTLAQVLTDNEHEVLIYDNNLKYIEKINNRQHPFFDVALSSKITATNSLEKALSYSEYIFLCIPAQNMRSLFKEINKNLHLSKNFVNLSKGIEYGSNKIIFQIIQEEIDKDKIKNYASLFGPSHAEEVIYKKITFLTISSLCQNFAFEIANFFSNKDYFKVFVSQTQDIVGFEICVSLKNVFALISGILDDDSFGTNARAAFITFSISEMRLFLNLFNVSFDTMLSLVGIGDLIVTAFNNNSRNYQAGQKIILGQTIEDISQQNNQIIEGIYNLKVFYNLSLQNKMNLPIIESAYKVIFEKKPISLILESIFSKK